MKYTNTTELLTYIKSQMVIDNVSNKELSERMNKAQSTISSIFRQKNITLDALKEICDALGYTLDIKISKGDTE